MKAIPDLSLGRLGTGGRLFDSHVPPAQVSITKDVRTLRYVGLEVPPDDTSDARLKASNVVAVLVYASAERMIREALISCDDPKTAGLLRSYFDTTRAMAVTGQGVLVTFRENEGAHPAVSVRVPIGKDDLDVLNAQTPAGIRVTVWKR